jgi:O-antigen/teichoic acid export membrane protein
VKIRRILKTSGALLGGQGISVCAQLILPALFLRAYGVVGFGEWITLTAAVSYLGTLNFGLQTFANNYVGIFHSRNELEEAKALQATSFALLVSIVGVAALLTLLFLFLPISSWLRLKLDSRTSSLIVYLLGLQVLTRMIFSFLAGSFLAVGVSYRGTNWNNAQTMGSLVGTALMALGRASFVSIAVLQLGLMLLFTLLVAFDLRFEAEAVFPKLSYLRLSRTKEILKPSGYFAVLFSSNFLVYQLPVIIMQRLLGPEKVVVFSLTRTIYSMSRTLLNSMSSAIGPEIVELYGQRNWPRLLRLYDLSERVIFALVPIVSLGTFLATPILITVWLHRPELYEVKVCICMALISAVTGAKEHKYQFQMSSNSHVEMACFWFVSYAALVILSLPAIDLYGVCGFLVLWLVTEVTQVVFVLRLNRRFFEHAARINFNPVYRLGALMVVATACCGWLALGTSVTSLVEIAVFTVIAMTLLAAISYPLFKVNEMSGSIFARLSRRVEINTAS